MGTIVARPRENGTIAYMAKITLKREGKTVHREAKTFDRRAAAAAWMARREEELEKPGAIERANTSRHTLAQVIDTYTKESRKKIGRTKTQVLETIKGYSIADLPCDKITSAEIIAFAQQLSKGREPSTVGNYISHLAAIFAIARPAWGYPLDQQAMKDAQAVAHRLGLSGKSKERDRRPTLDELNAIMTYFQNKRANSTPMCHVTAFAIFSTRRQEEITRITWADLDEKHSRIFVRDLKHPGEKIGNNTWCDLPERALAIIKAMPRIQPEIFPYSAGSIGAAFTRACAFLEIDDLHFHDLRHDGISLLFEAGLSIPRAAAVSAHRSWTSLKRYTHVREAGDKYAGWKWLPIVTQPPQRHRPQPDPYSALT